MQTFAKHVERLPAEDRTAIRDVVPPETWAAIESAGLLGWLPVSVNLECTRAVSTRLGPERTHQFFRELLLAAIDTPLLRGFVQAVLRVAVPDPGQYLPWLARGFELMFRDAGTWAVIEREPGWALLELKDLPRESVTDKVWINSVASSLAGLMDLTNIQGTVVVHEVDVKSGTVAFASKWTKKGNATKT
jgi:hypothetical protein